MKTRTNKLKGKFNSSVGKAKRMAGKATDDKDLEHEGTIQEGHGKAQKMVGAVEAGLQKAAHDVGKSIKKMGNKLERLTN